MKLLIWTLNLPGYAFKLIIYWVSYFTKKDKNTWIFGAWDGNLFCDNSKALFLYTIKEHSKINTFWLTKNKDLYKELKRKSLPVLYIWSLKGIITSLKAQVIFISHSSYDVAAFCITKKNTIIQLWHGTPLKKICHDNKLEKQVWNKPWWKKIIYTILLPYDNPNSTITIASSKKVKNIFKTSFSIHDERIVILGYPRNDQLKKTQHKTKKIIYIPTMRMYDKQLNYFDKIHSPELETVLKKHSTTLHIKLHPMDCSKTTSKNILIINNSDIHQHLGEYDILITDYSSIIFDYLLLNQPIIHYLFDHSKYITNERELYEDIEKIACGPIAKNAKELSQNIDAALSKSDNHKEKRQFIKNLYNEFDDQKSSKRVCDYILNLIKHPDTKH